MPCTFFQLRDKSRCVFVKWMDPARDDALLQVAIPITDTYPSGGRTFGAFGMTSMFGGALECFVFVVQQAGFALTGNFTVSLYDDAVYVISCEDESAIGSERFLAVENAAQRTFAMQDRVGHSKDWSFKAMMKSYAATLGICATGFVDIFSAEASRVVLRRKGCMDVTPVIIMDADIRTLFVNALFTYAIPGGADYTFTRKMAEFLEPLHTMASVYNPALDAILADASYSVHAARWTPMRLYVAGDDDDDDKPHKLTLCEHKRLTKRFWMRMREGKDREFSHMSRITDSLLISTPWDRFPSSEQLLSDPYELLRAMISKVWTPPPPTEVPTRFVTDLMRKTVGLDNPWEVLEEMLVEEVGVDHPPVPTPIHLEAAAILDGWSKSRAVRDVMPSSLRALVTKWDEWVDPDGLEYMEPVDLDAPHICNAIARVTTRAHILNLQLYWSLRDTYPIALFGEMQMYAVFMVWYPMTLHAVHTSVHGGGKSHALIQHRKMSLEVFIVVQIKLPSPKFFTASRIPTNYTMWIFQECPPAFYLHERRGASDGERKEQAFLKTVLGDKDASYGWLDITEDPITGAKRRSMKQVNKRICISIAAASNYPIPHDMPLGDRVFKDEMTPSTGDTGDWATAHAALFLSESFRDRVALHRCWVRREQAAILRFLFEAGAGKSGSLKPMTSVVYQFLINNLFRSLRKRVPTAQTGVRALKNTFKIMEMKCVQRAVRELIAFETSPFREVMEWVDLYHAILVRSHVSRQDAVNALCLTNPDRVREHERMVITTVVQFQFGFTRSTISMTDLDEHVKAQPALHFLYSANGMTMDPNFVVYDTGMDAERYMQSLARRLGPSVTDGQVDGVFARYADVMIKSDEVYEQCALLSDSVSFGMGDSSSGRDQERRRFTHESYETPSATMVRASAVQSLQEPLIRMLVRRDTLRLIVPVVAIAQLLDTVEKDPFDHFTDVLVDSFSSRMVADKLVLLFYPGRPLLTTTLRDLDPRSARHSREEYKFKNALHLETEVAQRADEDICTADGDTWQSVFLEQLVRKPVLCVRHDPDFYNQMLHYEVHHVGLIEQLEILSMRKRLCY